MLTVVSAYFNDRYYLPDCLRSVAEAAKLSPFPIHHIICDDASPYPPLKLPKDITYIRRDENGGPAAARNTAIRASATPYLMNLDADDMIHPEYFRRLGPYVGEHQVVYSDTHWFGAVDRDFSQWPLDSPARFVNHPLSSCLIFSRELWARTGGYNERKDLVGHEDWAFSCALAALSPPWKHVREPLYLYRRKTAGSLLEKVTSQKQERATIIRDLYGEQKT
jgi:glycosyltransferase involved in cell wall biosynthesis